MPAMSTAYTLLMEDQLRSIIAHDSKLKFREKCAGMIPAGVQSPLGDFPSDFSIRPRPKVVLVPRASSAATRRSAIPASMFRVFYERGDLPLQVSHASGNKLLWKTPLEKLDYHHYLPIFFDGIREQEEPVRFLAVQGMFDLIAAAKGTEKIVPVLPQLIIPMKTAMNSKDTILISTVLKAIQALLGTSPSVGKALVPYYRQLLPTFALFIGRNKNLGDRIDYGQRKGFCLGELINDTLLMLENSGGPDAFVNIKYMIPTYESAVFRGK